MSADTHTHIHQLMSYELVYTSIHSSIIVNSLFDNPRTLDSLIIIFKTKLLSTCTYGIITPAQNNIFKYFYHQADNLIIAN